MDTYLCVRSVACLLIRGWGQGPLKLQYKESEREQNNFFTSAEPFKQYCGSETFHIGSGSYLAGIYHPDPNLNLTLRLFRIRILVEVIFVKFS